MRKSLTTLAVIGLGTFLVYGCGSQAQKNKPVKPTDDNVGSLSWSLKFQSKCGEMVPADQCVGGWGFTILPDGQYQIGPGPENQVKKGALTAEEAKSVESLIGSLFTPAAPNAENHVTLGEAESEDSITFSRGAEAPHMLVRTAGTELFYTVSSGDEAKSVLTLLRTLTTKYYTVPFPDACADGAATVNELIASLQTCTQDTECGFFENLEPVAPNSADYLVTDDCGMVQTLAVGNTASVAASKTKLLEAIEKVRITCGERTTRPDCTGMNAIPLSGAKPVCKAGKCEVSGGTR